MKEHDRVVLNSDIDERRLKAGDIGTLVHVYPDREAVEIEFVALDGKTIAVVQASARQVRPLGANEIAHARALAIP